MRQIFLCLGEDGYGVVECPSLPGCVSQGEDKAKAVSNIRETIEGYFAALEEDGPPVPEERRFDRIVMAVGRAYRSFRGRQCLAALTKKGLRFKRQNGSRMILWRDEPYAQVVAPDMKRLIAGHLVPFSASRNDDRRIYPDAVTPCAFDFFRKISQPSSA